MRNRLLLPVILLIVGLAGGYGLGLTRDCSGPTREPTSQVKSLELASDTATAPSRSPAADPASPSVGIAPAAPPSVAQSEVNADFRANDLVSSWQDRERQMLRDPLYRDSLREAAKQRFAQTRADAIRAVGMSPEQADRVIDLWVERNLWLMENGDVTGNGNMSPERQSEMKRRTDAEQAEVRALLGDEMYADWTSYLQSSSERGEVNSMSAQLGGDALPAAKVDVLVAAFHAERQRAMQEYKEYRLALGATDPFANASVQDRQHYLDIERAANRRVHHAMAGSLTRVQLDKLDAMLNNRLVPIETALRLDTGKIAKSN